MAACDAAALRASVAELTSKQRLPSGGRHCHDTIQRRRGQSCSRHVCSSPFFSFVLALSSCSSTANPRPTSFGVTDARGRADELQEARTRSWRLHTATYPAICERSPLTNVVHSSLAAIGQGDHDAWRQGSSGGMASDACLRLAPPSPCAGAGSAPVAADQASSPPRGHPCPGVRGQSSLSLACAVRPEAGVLRFWSLLVPACPCAAAWVRAPPVSPGEVTFTMLVSGRRGRVYAPPSPMCGGLVCPRAVSEGRSGIVSERPVYRWVHVCPRVRPTPTIASSVYRPPVHSIYLYICVSVTPEMRRHPAI